MLLQKCIPLFTVAILVTSAMLLPFVQAEDRDGGETIVFIGTYNTADQPSIFRFRMNDATGELHPLGATRGIENPSFLALDPSGKHLFAVSEIANFDGKPTGAVAAFSVDPKTYDLKLLNQQPSAGDGPCHLIVDRTARCVLVANYGGGSVAALPINEDGTLSPPSSSIQHEGSSVTDRQTGPHAHSINVDAKNRFAFAADLGLDRVLVYRFDPENGTLEKHDPPAAEVEKGGGPRHFAFHPSGRYAYVNNELNSSVTAFAYDADHGRLTPIHTLSTLPKDFELRGSNSTAEVQVHPSGKFVYVSNRGHDSLAIFSVDQKTGKLTAVGHQPSGGRTPRNFGIHPSGRFILSANQDTGNVVVLKVDLETGKLQPTGAEVKVPQPVCVKYFVPSK